MTAESNATVAVEWIERLDRARVLIETAWMDDEPIPCEVTARNIVRDIVGEMRQRAALRTPATTDEGKLHALTCAISLEMLHQRQSGADNVHEIAKAALAALSTPEQAPATTGEGEVAARAVRALLDAFAAFEALPGDDFFIIPKTPAARQAWTDLAGAFENPALDLAALPPSSGWEAGAEAMREAAAAWHDDRAGERKAWNRGAEMLAHRAYAKALREQPLPPPPSREGA